MNWESLEKAQSHTHRSGLFLSVFLREKSAVDQILHVPSADVVASRLRGDQQLCLLTIVSGYAVICTSIISSG